jgi:hypothetical protein
MKTKVMWLLLGLLSIILIPGVTPANDGLDRYNGPTVLVHLHAPISMKAGFTVLKEDLEGGADGAPAFRWLRPEVAAVIQLVAADTYRVMGESATPLAIFDLSAENGDTPVEWDESSRPSGRHPGNSHDGGLNPDLGYFLTTLRGKFDDPDYAACDDHYSATEKDEKGNPKDLQHCAGPANRLDVDRQTYFYLRLFQMHAEQFDHQLLETVGIDHQVRQAVLAKARAWKNAGKYRITDSVIGEMEQLMTDDPWGGWARYHHHHTHLRFRNLDESGPFRKPLLDLAVKTRTLEMELLRDLAPGQKVFLKANLYSYRLGRSIEVSLLRPRTLAVKSCQYRLKDGEWFAAETPEDDYRYVFELPRRPTLKERSLTIEAKVTLGDDTSVSLTRDIFLPADNPGLTVEVHREAINADYRIESTGGGELWQLFLTCPPVYRRFITGVEFQVYFKDDSLEPTTLKGSGEGYSATYESKERGNIRCIEAVVTLSKRSKLLVPVFFSLE